MQNTIPEQLRSEHNKFPLNEIKNDYADPERLGPVCSRLELDVAVYMLSGVAPVCSPADAAAKLNQIFYGGRAIWQADTLGSLISEYESTTNVDSLKDQWEELILASCEAELALEGQEFDVFTKVAARVNSELFQGIGLISAEQVERLYYQSNIDLGTPGLNQMKANAMQQIRVLNAQITDAEQKIANNPYSGALAKAEANAKRTKADVEDWRRAVIEAIDEFSSKNIELGRILQENVKSANEGEERIDYLEAYLSIISDLIGSFASQGAFLSVGSLSELGAKLAEIKAVGDDLLMNNETAEAKFKEQKGLHNEYTESVDLDGLNARLAQLCEELGIVEGIGELVLRHRALMHQIKKRFGVETLISEMAFARSIAPQFQEKLAGLNLQAEGVELAQIWPVARLAMDDNATIEQIADSYPLLQTEILAVYADLAQPISNELLLSVEDEIDVPHQDAFSHSIGRIVSLDDVIIPDEFATSDSAENLLSPEVEDREDPLMPVEVLDLEGSIYAPLARMGLRYFAENEADREMDEDAYSIADNLLELLEEVEMTSEQYQFIYDLITNDAIDYYNQFYKPQENDEEETRDLIAEHQLKDVVSMKRFEQLRFTRSKEQAIFLEALIEYRRNSGAHLCADIMQQVFKDHLPRQVKLFEDTVSPFLIVKEPNYDLPGLNYNLSSLSGVPGEYGRFEFDGDNRLLSYTIIDHSALVADGYTTFTLYASPNKTYSSRPVQLSVVLKRCYQELKQGLSNGDVSLVAAQDMISGLLEHINETKNASIELKTVYPAEDGTWTE